MLSVLICIAAPAARLLATIELAFFLSRRA